MSNTFQINDLSLRYAREMFNDAWSNERSVEVALGRWFLDRFPTPKARQIASGMMQGPGLPVLEVGCVMPYYGRATHEIIDLADEHPSSRKVNALDMDYAGRNVLAISTLEHMHTREYSNGSDMDGVTCLTKILTSATNYCITFPTQYNDGLTAYLQANPSVPRIILRRINWKNEYVVHADRNDFSIPFGHSDRPIPDGWWNNANGIVVVTNLKELL